MLSAIGISEWAAALITVWLVAQLPLGMLVGFYLRRMSAMNFAPGAIVAPEPAQVYAPLGKSWPEFLPVPVAPRAL